LGDVPNTCKFVSRFNDVRWRELQTQARHKMDAPIRLFARAKCGHEINEQFLKRIFSSVSVLVSCGLFACFACFAVKISAFSAVTQHSLPVPVNESVPQKAQFTPENQQSVPYSLSFCPISVKYCLEF
jgi:hypothetical protein